MKVSCPLFASRHGRLAGGIIVPLMTVGICCNRVYAQANLRLLQDVNLYLNYNRNNGVGGPYEEMFYPTNNVINPQDAREPQNEDLTAGLQGLKDIVAKAASEGKRVRAFGSRWSSNDLPYVEDYLVDTSGLQYAKIGIDNASYLTQDYRDRQKILTFVQGGVMTKYMYKTLFKKGLTLSASGLSDGQTMAGGISTSTHNAAVNYGSMPDYVLGIHLVLKDETVFLQKESEPAVTDLYAAVIGADRIINDDDIFYAALVGLGSFGLIHGFLIEPEPLFRLNVEVKEILYEQALEALFTVDAPSIGFEIADASALPHHFEAYINPYRLDQASGCQVRVMQKIHLLNDAQFEIRSEPTYRAISPMQSGTFSKYETLFSAAGILGGHIARFIYGIFAQVLIEMIMHIGGDEDGYPLEVYGDNSVGDYYVAPGLKAITMEVAMPLSHLRVALPLVLQALHDNPTFVQVNLRYVQGTRATMGFAKYDGINAMIDLPAADIPPTRVAFQKVQEVLEANRDSIDFTYHIGKYLMPGNEDWVHKSYGEAAVDWMTQRERLLTTTQEREMFSNQFLEDYGLA
jgi:FAD binding domain